MYLDKRSINFYKKTEIAPTFIFNWFGNYSLPYIFQLAIVLLVWLVANFQVCKEKGKQKIGFIKFVTLDWVCYEDKILPLLAADHRSAPTIVGVNFLFHL